MTNKKRTLFVDWGDSVAVRQTAKTIESNIFMRQMGARRMDIRLLPVYCQFLSPQSVCMKFWLTRAHLVIRARELRFSSLENPAPVSARCQPSASQFTFCKAQKYQNMKLFFLPPSHTKVRKHSERQQVKVPFWCALMQTDIRQENVTVVTAFSVKTPTLPLK